MSILIQVVKKEVIVLREKKPCDRRKFRVYITSTGMIFASLRSDKLYKLNENIYRMVKIQLIFWIKKTKEHLPDFVFQTVHWVEEG